MECMLYNKQYTGKSEATFNLRLINHRCKKTRLASI